MNRSLFFAIFVFLSACVTTPTGRSQLILFPDRQIDEMGVSAFTEIKQKASVETDSKVRSYVQCVAQAVLEVSQDEPFGWEVVVFKDKAANAFALPGKKIGVYTGLLDVAVNADQLATVLGHEVAHVIAKHGNERVSQAVLAQGGMEIVDSLLAERRGRTLVLGALGLGAQYGYLYPHSRRQEAEADEIGLLIMARAGFDPQQSIELWHNMHKAANGQPPEFLSTHPSHASRIAKLTEIQPKARRLSHEAHEKGRRPKCQA